MFPATFETDRLRFIRYCRETISPFDLYDLTSHSNPSIDEETRYLPWNPIKTVKEAADRLASFEQKWADRERAEWLITPTEGEDGAGKFAGSAGLICQWEQNLAMPAIWLRKPFWGRGYSGERADALLDIVFGRLDLDLAAVPVQDGNDKSRQAVEKYIEAHGGQYDGIIRNSTVRPSDEIIDHHRYTISQEQYQSTTVSTGNSI